MDNKLMRAVTFKEFGNPDVLSISHIPLPQPAAEQLLVKVKATALNRADLLQRRGKYPAPPGESDILGLEIAGEIVAIGNKVFNFKIGDRICGLVGGGAYAEYCLIDHLVAMPLPTDISFTDAAAIPEAFLTASEAAITLGYLQPHESILIHAGASGVGSAAIQIAQQLQSQIFTTVGTQDKKNKLENLFKIKHIINYKQQDFFTEINRLTQHKGVNVIIDFIGASYLMENVNSLKTQGRLICVGLMGGTKAEIDLSIIQKRRLQIKGLVMRTRSLAEKRIITQSFIKNWLPLFSQGKLKPVIDSIFPFEQVQAAHQHMEKNANLGKIILSIE